MTKTALDRACEKLRRQEIERQHRKACEIFKKQQNFLQKRKRKRGQPLLIWEYYIRQRKKLTTRIMKRTGKSPPEMLLNCSGLTEKAMILRLFEQAEKLSPENKWRFDRLQHSTTRCGLLYSLPDENVLRRNFEIYGLPEVIKTESQSTCCIQNWFKSKVVAQRLEEKKYDIHNIVQFFPDVEGLQIVGKSAKIYQLDDKGSEGSRSTSPTRKKQKATRIIVKPN